jgi:hypothetical protein
LELNRDDILARLSGLSDAELVAMLEVGEPGYKPEALQVALDLLDRRGVSAFDRYLYAVAYWREQFPQRIRDVVFSDEVIQSHFLTTQELSVLLNDALNAWNRRAGFISRHGIARMRAADPVKPRTKRGRSGSR